MFFATFSVASFAFLFLPHLGRVLFQSFSKKKEGFFLAASLFDAGYASRLILQIGDETMSQMPRGELLTREMSEMLPLYCYVEKRAIQTLLQQGVKVNEKTRLEIIEVHYAGEAGGIVCGIKPPEGKNMLFMSATNFRFTDEGAIYDKINEYKKARIKWLNEEERKDRRMGLGPRIKNIEIDNAGPSDDASPKVSRNAPCPCGSGKKYKHCCLK